MDGSNLEDCINLIVMLLMKPLQIGKLNEKNREFFFIKLVHERIWILHLVHGFQYECERRSIGPKKNERVHFFPFMNVNLPYPGDVTLANERGTNGCNSVQCRPVCCSCFPAKRNNFFPMLIPIRMTRCSRKDEYFKNKQGNSIWSVSTSDRTVDLMIHCQGVEK